MTQVANGYDDKDLVYAPRNDCICGAPLAYPRPATRFASWACSKVLKGEAGTALAHTQPERLILAPIFRLKEDA